MDNFLSSLKSKFTKNETNGPRVAQPIVPSLPEDRVLEEKKKEEVRETMSKIDPNSLVDAEDIAEMNESSASDEKPDMKPQSSKGEVSNPTHAPDTILGFKVLKKGEEEDKTDYMPNPIEDDIFIYYD